MANLKLLKIYIYFLKSLTMTLLFVAFTLCDIAEALPVFPGAQGFGSETLAGRGGTVYKVTNLNASGPGSLLYAIQQSDPRVVVFEVSGTIQINGFLDVENPYITIAGQTAPSPGITLRNTTLRIRTHDVFVQHLRVRVGDAANGPEPQSRDAINIGNPNIPVYNVVIDHCSASWSVDEVVSTWYTTNNTTIQNCIVSEALDNSIHPEGAHSMGFLVGQNSDSVSVLRNLIAHNRHRSPRLGPGPKAEIINNLIYNWQWNGTDIVSDGGVAQADMIGNYYKPGPGTYAPHPGIHVGGAAGTLIYVKDNIGPGRLTNTGDEWNAVDGSLANRSYTPLQPSGNVTVHDVGDLENFLLDRVGARPADRDAVDIRIVNDVKNSTGGFINSQNEVNGWPTLAQNTRTLTVPNNPNGDSDGDGYTNLEEWLHAFSAQVEGNVNDTEAPTIPDNLQVQVLSSSQIDLSWDASTDNVGVTGYNIYRDGTQITTTASTTYQGTGLSPSTTYTYTVSAYDAAGNESGQSISVSATTQPPDNEGPTIPGNLQATAISSSQINLSWNTSTDNVGVTGYNVYRDGNQVANTAGTTYQDTGLSPSTTYTYTVSAYDAEGNESGQSSAISATTQDGTTPSSDYTILKTDIPPIIDGNLSEFTDANAIQITDSTTGTTGTYKLMWDNTALYISASVSDTTLNANNTARDSSIWNDDSIECMFDTLNNNGADMQSDDYKFLVNILNTQRDSQGTGTGRNSAWNITYTSQISTQGTVNNDADTDTGYTIEMSIPWSSWGVTAPQDNTMSGFDIALNDLNSAGSRIQTPWLNATGGGANDPDGWGDVIFSSQTISTSDTVPPSPPFGLIIQ